MDSPEADAVVAARSEMGEISGVSRIGKSPTAVNGSITASETRTTSVEETSSADAESLACDVRDEKVGHRLLKAYNAILLAAKRQLDEPRPTFGGGESAGEIKAAIEAWVSYRRMAVEDRKFALSQLQSLLDMALKHTAKRRVTGETQSATAITKDQLAELEQLPAEGRQACLLALKENRGRIREILKKYGKESPA